MTAHHEELYQAVLAEPLDDAPRLVYADWLEEQGDPRAEFIRVQIELSQLPPKQKKDKNDPRLLREQTLLHQFGRSWTPPSMKWVHWRDFMRGWVGQVHIIGWDGFTDFADRIFASAPVTHLLMTSPKANSHCVQRFAQSKYLRYLVHLNLSGTSLSAEDMQRFAASEHLLHMTQLNLCENPLHDAGLAALASATFRGQVESLQLRVCNMQAAGWEALAQQSASWLQLQELDLENNALGPLNVPGTGSPLRFPRLKRLFLRRNRLGDSGVERLMNSLECPELQTLNLDHNEITAAGVEALAQSPILQQIKYLSLNNNALDSASARALNESPYLSNIQGLALQGNPFSKSTNQALKNRFGKKVYLTTSNRNISLSLLEEEPHPDFDIPF